MILWCPKINKYFLVYIFVDMTLGTISLTLCTDIMNKMLTKIFKKAFFAGCCIC